MNQTKKITQGAMMLAIVGALILVDRMTAYFFTELIVLLMPVVVIMYSTMHTFKDGLMLSVGLLIICFLLGNFQLTYLIYAPIGLLTGLSYSLGIKKGMDKRSLLMVAILSFVLGEVIATLVIYPLLGFPVGKMIEEYRVSLQEMGTMAGVDYANIFAQVGLDFPKLTAIMYIFATILMGLMEGVLIHLISVFMLKRFKIADLGNVDIWKIKPNPVLAYVSMASLFLLFFARSFSNETLYYGAVIVAILGSMVLLYYGYIFVILYGVKVLRRNVGAFFVLLCVFFPPLLMTLMIMGFLYGAGPLRAYLEARVADKQ